MESGPDEEETNTATMRPLFRPAPAEDLVAPAQEIGRFMVLGRIGSGGMGQVFAAYDPVLDRRVALKLLHAERTEKDRDALVREAKALARLSHPNVVAVHDVGVHDGQVFLAMEFVEGTTLKAWMAQQHKHRVVAALEVLHQAGLGLAAAHEAGLVHGDFKPQNVLVGSDGRVRVVDFGLARAERGATKHQAVDPERTLHDGETSDEDSRGIVAGTPAYMAPEHRREGRTDVRTDQYSYCVTAWEVLFRSRPPAVGEAAEVPAVALSALKKGLATKRSGRHRSMVPLLAAVQTAYEECRGDRSHRLRRAFGASAAFALLVAVGAGYWMGQDGETDSPCSGAEAELAKVWNDEVRADVRRALLRPGVDFVEHTERVVANRLDSFAAAWTTGYTDACAASELRHEQSSQVMDLRMTCLDGQRRSLRATVDVLRSLEPERVRKAINLVDRLPSPADCEDLKYVQQLERTPVPKHLRERVDALRQELARIDAMHGAGRYADAHEAAEKALGTANALGFAPLVAEANYRFGLELKALDRGAEAVAPLKRAFLQAQTGDDGRLAAQSAIALTSTEGEVIADATQGLLWSDIALSLARRVDGERGNLVARSLSARADLFSSTGDYESSLAVREESMALLDPSSLSYAAELADRGTAYGRLGKLHDGLNDLERALDLHRQRLGPKHPIVADILHNLALENRRAGRYQDGLRHILGARDIYVAAQGPSGRDVASCDSAAALLYARIGEPQKALTSHQRALTLLERTLGPEHPEVGTEHINTAITLAETGKLDQAIASFERGLAVLRPALGDTHPFTLSSTMNLANALSTVGKLEEAQRLYEDALSNRLEGAGPRIEAQLRSNLGLVHADRGDYEAALREYDAALEVFRNSPESFEYQNTLSNAIDAWLELGRTAPALASAEELVERSHGDPTVVARAKFQLARALWETGGDRQRATALAEAARVTYAAAEGFDREAATVLRWQTKHGLRAN